MSRIKQSLVILASVYSLVQLAGCGGSTPASNTVAQAPAPLMAESAEFTGARNNYVIIKNGTSYQVKDQTDPSASRTVYSGDYLQFRDLSVNLKIAELSSSISRTNLNAIFSLYLAYFNRLPDANGLAYWITQFNNGLSFEAISESFYSVIRSNPEQYGYGLKANQSDFVWFLYQNILGRTGINAPSQTEMNYWIQALEAGQISRTQAITLFANTALNYEGNSDWDWVSQQWRNKLNLAYFFAVRQGISYNNPQDNLVKTRQFVAAVTPQGNSAAIALMNLKDNKFNLTGFADPEALAEMCTPLAEKNWTRAHLDNIYLWYQDISEKNPAQYVNSRDYFSALLVRAKDRFSFTDDQGGIDDYFQSGANVGYGASFVNQNGNLRIRYVQPGSPADQARLGRGTTIVSIDGSSTLSGLTQAHIDALYPSDNRMHRFEVRDAGSTSIRSLSMSAAKVTISPVMNEQILNLDGRRYGYFLFTDHIRTAEAPLYEVMTRFKAAIIDDLILDLRYNGGGYLYIANELAAMIGGERTANQIFEQLQFNDKYADMTADNVDYFYDTDSRNRSLPYLNLPRVFVLVGAGTCSASESIINGLSPFVQVILIGQNTCGKPYGFIQKNNCKTAYFAIQFAGVNALAKGDYANGFNPQCYTSDDLEHALGDTAETRLATAINYAKTGKCSSSSFSPPPPHAGDSKEGEVQTPLWRQIKLRGKS